MAGPLSRPRRRRRRAERLPRIGRHDFRPAPGVVTLFACPQAPNGLIVLLIVLLIFGGSQLPKLAKNLGKAQKEFKDGLSEGSAEKPDSEKTPEELAAELAAAPQGGCRRQGAGSDRSRRDTGDHAAIGSRDQLIVATSRRRSTRSAAAPGSRARRCASGDRREADDADGARQSTSTVSRRRFRMRRRSRSLHPPHTPWSMRCSRAYSRHGAVTGQVAQILRALSTPTPSLGKNVAGGIEAAVAVGHPRRGRVLGVQWGARRFHVHRCCSLS